MRRRMKEKDVEKREAVNLKKIKEKIFVQATRQSERLI